MPELFDCDVLEPSPLLFFLPFERSDSWMGDSRVKFVYVTLDVLINGANI